MSSYIFKKLEMSIAVHMRETKCCKRTFLPFSFQYLLKNTYIGEGTSWHKLVEGAPPLF